MTIRVSLGWSLSQQVGLYVLQFIHMVVIARLLTPEEVGIFVLAMSISLVLLVIREFGLTNYLITVEELTRDNLRTTMGMSVIMAVVMAIIVILIRQPLADFVSAQGAADVMICVAVLILLSPLELPAQAILRRDMRFDTLHHAGLVGKLLGVALSISLAWNGYSYMALAWALVFEAAVRSVWVAVAEPRAIRAGISLRNFRDVFSFSIWSTGVSLAMSLIQMVEKLLVGRVLGVGSAGIYDRSLQIPTMLRMGLVLVTGRVFVAAFAQEVRAGNPIGDKVRRLVAITTVLLWPVYAILTLIAHELVVVIFGRGWLQVAVMIPWIFAAQGIQAALIPPEHVLFPNGKAFRAFCNRAIQFVVYVAMIAIGLSYGLNAFLMMMVVAAVFVSITNWIAMRPYVDLAATDVLAECGRTVVITALSAAPVALVRYGFPNAPDTWLLGALLTTPFAWLGALFLTQHPLVAEFQRVLQWLAARRQSEHT